MKPFSHARLRCAAVLVSVLYVAGAHAGHRGFGGHDEDGEHDHDRARHALDRGEVRPLAEILRQVHEQVPGEVVSVELERSQRPGKRRWIYEFRIIAPDGRVLEVRVDAATGRILAQERE